ncbi:MAG: peptidoglycan-binding protein [Clostridiales bacterium]|jgi:peptidoglycan hydrolase-like protein with peptidoglycan-binding domain|nr:peptidoglycan-binding protein [Clostridiales bacterium]
MSRQAFTDQGGLQISVVTESGSKPVENASVQVTPKSLPGNVIDEFITDISGQTSEMMLPAPPLEYSMQPDGGQPYSEYDVQVEMDGYEPTLVEGVQIFPNTTAIQSIGLEPQKSSLNAPINTIHIQEPVLWGVYPPKIPEDMVKELPPSTGFVVLPHPVVPETVVVHNGAPSNASAQNYWVPFKNYIKNVASCEIYSNWPESTIRANILAILSFTLNRVYTEWYRSKGYNFTITNSTAYDHAFTYGRNIFDEISIIVDDIFTSFITKPNIRQPLFAQYCDGKRSTCPNWMTQWGSKDLGDKGYSAIDILKNFYGSDVYLMQTEKVEGVPSSFSGTNLQMGSSGSDVRTIQEQLNAVSNNYPAIKKMRVDGEFNDATREAVEKFQEIFRLPSSGIVDYPTWYKISEIYVGVTKMAELTN